MLVMPPTRRIPGKIYRRKQFSIFNFQPPEALMSIRRSLVLTTALMVLLGGCLPYSCRQTEPRALFPSDSLSRNIASRLTSDTLHLAHQSSGPENHPLEYPTSIVRSPDGRLYVSDAKRNTIYVFTADGQFESRFQSSEFSYPFLAGFRGDSLIVLNRGSSTLDFVLDSTVVKSLDVPEGPDAMATATESGIFYKVVADDPWFGANVPGYITHISPSGNPTEPRVELPGASWRHRGYMRMWGDTLVSLTGYRPVLDLISRDGSLDTLDLRGFDSPMLARSRAFMQGTVDTPPVLSSSAFPADSLLYVLNLRPHQVRIDVYDRNGQLQTVYQEPGRPSAEAPDVFPMDLTVLRDSTGTRRFAVVMYKPNPSLRVYETK